MTFLDPRRGPGSDTFYQDGNGAPFPDGYFADLIEPWPSSPGSDTFYQDGNGAPFPDGYFANSV